MRKIISHHFQHVTRDCGFRGKRFIQEYVCFFLLTLLVVAPALQGNGQSRPKFVKYCSLFDSTYDERTVSSIALMFYSTVGRVDGGDTFLYSPDCNGPDYFSIPSGNSKVWGKWQSFFDKLPPEKNLAIEIKFEGKPDVAIAGLFGSLDGWARAEIKFSKIVSIRDVTSSTNAVVPNHNAAKPNVERIEGLRNDLRNFLQTLYSPSNARQDMLNSLPDDFVFVDFTGKSFKRDQYLSLNAPWDTASAGLKESRMSSRLKSKTNDTMIWRGTFVLGFTSAPTKIYYCDVTFVLRDGKWTLRRAAMVHSASQK